LYHISFGVHLKAQFLPTKKTEEIGLIDLLAQGRWLDGRRKEIKRALPLGGSLPKTIREKYSNMIRLKIKN